jgi:hypothetical protein
MNGSDSAERARAEPIDADFAPAARRARAAGERRSDGVGLGTVVTASVLAAMSGTVLGAFLPRVPGVAALMDQAAPNDLTSVRTDLARVRASVETASAEGTLPSRTELAQAQASLAEIDKKLGRYEQGLQLLTGGPAEFEPLRRRLAAIEAVPAEGASPLQVARAVAALQTRMATVEEITSKGAAFEAAAAFGDPAALAQRIQTLQTGLKDVQDKIGSAASAAEVQAIAQQVIGLQVGFGKVAKDAERASKAAAAAYAVSAATEAARAAGPFEPAYAALNTLLPGDSNVAALASYAKTGAPTTGELREDFRTLEVEIVRAARMSDSGGGAWGQIQAWLAQFVVVRRLDDAGTSAAAIVERAAKRIAAEDLAGGVAELGKLSGPPAKVAAPWLDKARARLEIDGRLAKIRAQLAAQGS